MISDKEMSNKKSNGEEKISLKEPVRVVVRVRPPVCDGEEELAISCHGSFLFCFSFLFFFSYLIFFSLHVSIDRKGSSFSSLAVNKLSPISSSSSSSSSSSTSSSSSSFSSSSSPQKYHFDGVYGPLATNQTLQEERVGPLLLSFLGGFNACVLAYGQTGSGKTFTMLGSGGGTG